eukprot:1076922-Prymnesium_polylepis.1
MAIAPRSLTVEVEVGLYDVLIASHAARMRPAQAYGQPPLAFTFYDPSRQLWRDSNRVGHSARHVAVTWPLLGDVHLPPLKGGRRSAGVTCPERHVLPSVTCPQASRAPKRHVPSSVTCPKRHVPQAPRALQASRAPKRH